MTMPLCEITKKGTYYVQKMWKRGLCVVLLKEALTSSPVLRPFDHQRQVQFHLDPCKRVVDLSNLAQDLTTLGTGIPLKFKKLK